MCNGVKLQIELANFAKVNDYTLQLIGIKGLVTIDIIPEMLEHASLSNEGGVS